MLGSCGPFWMPVPNRNFGPACRQHDLDYAQQKISRKEADARFLKNMLILAHGNKTEVRWAYAYYYAVKYGGWTSWWWVSLKKWWKK